MEPFRTRLQLFTGKGGVGKSTVTAAMALAAAQEGHEPLIVELGHRATMESIFGGSIGSSPVRVVGGRRPVHAMNLTFRESLYDFVKSVVRVAPVAKRILATPAVSRFFDAAPAVAEFVAIRRLAELVREKRFHPIFVDLDATGHALMFLSLHEVLQDIGVAGPVGAVLRQSQEIFADPDLTCINLVTTPSLLPVQETVQLYERLREMGTPELGYLVVNRREEEGVGDADLAALAELRRVGRFDAELGVAEALRRDAERSLVAEARLYGELELPVIKTRAARVTERSNELDVASITAMGQQLAAALGGWG